MTQPSSDPGEPSPALSEREAAFERARKISGAVLAPVAFAATWWLTEGALPPHGQRLAAVLLAVVVLWVTEPIPLAVTAALGAAACLALGVAGPESVLPPFLDPIIFLFIGSFVLARAMMVHGLDRRIAMAFLTMRWVSGHPVRVFGGLGAVTALVSMWVSNTTTTAMMLPIGLGILQTLGRVQGGKPLGRGWPYASGMMLMIAYAASIGGIGTPVGSPPNLIAIGQIRALAKVEISFFGWMMLAVPMLLVMGIALFLLLRLLHSADAVETGTADDLRKYLARERAALGPWSPGQRSTLAVFALAVVLWMLPGVFSLVLAKDHAVMQVFHSKLWEPGVALVAAGILLLPVSLRPVRSTLTLREAVRIDWGTIVLFGGGLSLGGLMLKTGLAGALGQRIIDSTGAGSLWTLTAAAIGLGIVISEATSNTAAATMIIPVVIALAEAAGVDPVPPALGACFGASYGFMLPVSTPPNAIVYGSGLVPITSMIRAGLLFDVAGFFIILGALRVLYPLLGVGG
jgi:sodium-dependent dicarboxylate transporter 2/3/5